MASSSAVKATPPLKLLYPFNLRLISRSLTTPKSLLIPSPMQMFTDANWGPQDASHPHPTDNTISVSIEDTRFIPSHIAI